MQAVSAGVLVVLPVAAYAAGSLPFGAWVARRWAGVDVRAAGSGNIGATNVRRLAGLRAGLLTLAADVGKGLLPALVARHVLPGEPLFVGLVILAAFFGHLYPIFSGFKGGGKGVATAAGGIGAVTPGGILTALLVFVMAACWSERVSVGSLSAAAALPLCVWEATRSPVHLGTALVLAGFIFWRHRPNIRRLIDGTEPRID